MATPKTKSEPVEDVAPAATPILEVLSNFTVEDNTEADGAVEEAPVEESETTLVNGMTLVSYQ